MFVLGGRRSQAEATALSSTVAFLGETRATLRFSPDTDMTFLDAIKFLAISVLQRVSRYKEAS